MTGSAIASFIIGRLIRERSLADNPLRQKSWEAISMKSFLSRMVKKEMRKEAVTNE